MRHELEGINRSRAQYFRQVNSDREGARYIHYRALVCSFGEAALKGHIAVQAVRLCMFIVT